MGDPIAVCLSRYDTIRYGACKMDLAHKYVLCSAQHGPAEEDGRRSFAGRHHWIDEWPPSVVVSICLVLSRSSCMSPIVSCEHALVCPYRYPATRHHRRMVACSDFSNHCDWLHTSARKPDDAIKLG